MKIVQQSAELIANTPDPERVIELAGRTCWQSCGRITESSHIKFVEMLKDKQHDSVLEHASATLRLTTDRAIANELVRHRIGMSYSQESTRYVKPSELEVIAPSIKDMYQLQHWTDAMLMAEQQYRLMLESGSKPEIARSVLPLCTKTEIVTTGTFRAWRHFLKMRLASSAHPEMRYLARLVANVLVGIAPTVFSDYNGDTVRGQHGQEA